ncbi:hypothetical protein FYK55_22140 [Roseiconus nitratireducens]|uniref:Uncharacterized protein n=1 Tax=Roseiconus nitratireducens TaxID=2605748 RepID=A0A5M6CXV1_9BACT|nr:hypothetical protein [Roseiconus nitratireducens]KAA5540021.1 hypothetical protein FYK55_22140 [Roseiconus nitratireducens]
MLKTQLPSVFTRSKILFGGICFAAMLCSSATAQETSPVFMVEENWEMVINEPDVAINSPQVAFFLYPDADCSTCYFQLQMNYAAEAGYSSGGFRVGAFVDEQPVDDERSQIQQCLAWDGDTIRWTSAVAVFDGKVMMAVKDGFGWQWGAFGGPEYLVEMSGQDIHDLNHYTPETSAASVDIGFGKNRVASIHLKSVRITLADGTVRTINVDQQVH